MKEGSPDVFRAFIADFWRFKERQCGKDPRADRRIDGRTRLQRWVDASKNINGFQKMEPNSKSVGYS